MDLRTSTGLDPARAGLERAANVVLPRGRSLAALRGSWLGHALHPAFTDLPIGFWTSAMPLDVLHRDPETARMFIGLGVLSAMPTVATGLADWSALGDPGDERVGVVHAAANAAAIALYSASWLLRRSGRERTGVAVSFGAGTAATIAGVLGGQLALAPTQESGTGART